MSIREVTMYQLVCDRCGKTAQEDGDFSAMSDPDDARSDGESGSWLMDFGPDEDKDYCYECVEWDDEMVGTPKAVDAGCLDVEESRK